MKKLLVISICILTSNILCAQFDTLIINNDYKFKIGIRGIAGKSAVPSLEPETFNVFNFGVSLMYKINNSKSFIETGIFTFNRRYSYYNPITHKNIKLPLKYRLETKVIYFTIGIYGSYLYSTDINHRPFYQSSVSDRVFNFGHTSSIGIEKSFTNQFSIFVEGEYSSDLTSLLKEQSFFYFNDSYAHNYISYGLSVGVNYKIPTKRN